MPETMGGGVAVLDFDGDGRPDLLFVSGTPWPRRQRVREPGSSLALYPNEGNGPDGVPRFRNVTRQAGLQRVFYGMGASVADYDNDGRDDVYVTALNRNFLFHNLGGRFDEVSSPAGVRDNGWGTSSAWLDYDQDGRSDLFVCRYVDWSPARDLFCTLDGKTKSYCTPERYPGAPSRLYRNAGKGRFQDVTNHAGVGNANQKALGRGPLGLRRRRLDRHPRGQRHLSEQPVPQQGRRHVRRRRHSGRRGRGWMLTRVLAQEVQADRISVNELIPGPVATEIGTGDFGGTGTTTFAGEWSKTPDDVVPLALMLATQPNHGPSAQSFSLMRRDN